jgi:hypothetical protein
VVAPQLLAFFTLHLARMDLRQIGFIERGRLP